MAEGEAVMPLFYFVAVAQPLILPSIIKKPHNSLNPIITG